MPIEDTLDLFDVRYPNREGKGYRDYEMLDVSFSLGVLFTPFVEFVRSFREALALYDGILCGINHNGNPHSIAKIGKDYVDPADGQTYLWDDLKNRVFFAWTNRS